MAEWTDGQLLFPAKRTVHNPWEKTPRWHWRRLAGYAMRRWSYDEYSIGGEYDGEWKYASYEQCARSALEETYGEASRAVGDGQRGEERASAILFD